MNRLISLVAIASCLTLLCGCKFVATADIHKSGSLNSAEAPDKGFDGKVIGLWSSKVLPYAERKAGTLAEVQTALTADADEAGQKYGYRDKSGTSPWTVLAHVDGKIIAANTESKAATIDIDIDGDGKADATVQIGPVIRGTAIRDALDFINFNDFTNQIDFAQFGKAFNSYANSHVLSAIPSDALTGKSVKVLGAYQLPQAGQVPLVTPLEFELQK